MTASIPANQIAEIQALLEKWQTRLNLMHWRIQISARRPNDPNALFEVATNRNRNHASVRISDRGALAPDRERLLVHELVHLIIDPIREEYDFQAKVLPPDRRDEYSARLMRQLERAVEHLSHVV